MIEKNEINFTMTGRGKIELSIESAHNLYIITYDGQYLEYLHNLKIVESLPVSILTKRLLTACNTLLSELNTFLQYVKIHGNQCADQYWYIKELLKAF